MGPRDEGHKDMGVWGFSWMKGRQDLGIPGLGTWDTKTSGLGDLLGLRDVGRRDLWAAVTAKNTNVSNNLESIQTA